MNTPDTERAERESRFLKDFRAGKFINAKTGLQNPFEIETWWNNEISSRDTYWKERVRETVEGMKKDIRTETGPTNEEDWDIHCGKIWGWNSALDTLLDNLK